MKFSTTLMADHEKVMASMKQEDCCGLLDLKSNCKCEAGIKPKQMVAKKAGKIISKALQGLPNYAYRYLYVLVLLRV